MATFHLLKGNVDLVPPDSLFMFEDRLQTSAKTEDDIYGTPVVITWELPSGRTTWTMGAAYVSLETLQDVIDAYSANDVLGLVDESGSSIEVLISDYPDIERHKTLTDVLYTVKINLIRKRTIFVPPPVLTTLGPRLFGR